MREMRAHTPCPRPYSCTPYKRCTTKRVTSKQQAARRRAHEVRLEVLYTGTVESKAAYLYSCIVLLAPRELYSYTRKAPGSTHYHGTTASRTPVALDCC